MHTLAVTGASDRPDKRRLLAAFQRRTHDRVPNWEFYVMRRVMEAHLGADRVASVRERYRAGETIWPARSESEATDRSPLA